jgi:glycerol uptake facilitator-like aquaporin
VRCFDVVSDLGGGAHFPAITVARSVTNSFAGIAPADMPAFSIAQLAGALAGMAIANTLFPADPE